MGINDKKISQNKKKKKYKKILVIYVIVCYNLFMSGSSNVKFPFYMKRRLPLVGVFYYEKVVYILIMWGSSALKIIKMQGIIVRLNI